MPNAVSLDGLQQLTLHITSISQSSLLGQILGVSGDSENLSRLLIHCHPLAGCYLFDLTTSTNKFDSLKSAASSWGSGEQASNEWRLWGASPGGGGRGGRRRGGSSL